MVTGKLRIEINVEGSGRGLTLRQYTKICLEELRKTTKNLSQDSRFGGRHLKPAASKYEARVVTSRLRLVRHYRYRIF
jgi:hypothetical protein